MLLLNTLASVGAELTTAPTNSLGYSFLSQVTNKPLYEQPKTTHGPFKSHSFDIFLLKATMSSIACLKGKLNQIFGTIAVSKINLIDSGMTYN